MTKELEKAIGELPKGVRETETLNRFVAKGFIVAEYLPSRLFDFSVYRVSGGELPFPFKVVKGEYETEGGRIYILTENAKIPKTTAFPPVPLIFL
jgi:hypothetical protein